MPQERTAAEISEETQQFVRQVRRVTRRRFTPEEKVRIVLEGSRGEVRVSDLCRREGIRPNVYYARPKEFMGASHCASPLGISSPQCGQKSPPVGGRGLLQPGHCVANRSPH